MRKLLLILIIILPFNIDAQNVSLESFGPSFFYPTDVVHAGDSRLFITEQAGLIKILRSDGTVPATPFLDITSLVYDDYENSWERGLLGLVFHPNYSSNGYFYVHYADQDENSVISRFSVTANPDVADPSSELILLNTPSPNGYHYGGDMKFGPDGYLYLSKGDGGLVGDPDNEAQDLNSLLGKILRIDVDNTSGGNNYDIPSNNPFENDGDPNTRGEIWAYGLRNPSNISFDSATGDLWIADVGQDDWEEINFNQGNISGLNYGWSCFEADDTFNTYPSCPSIGSTTLPVHQVAHSNSPRRCAIAGGLVYRGSNYPSFVGKYFAGDWCSGEIYILSNSGGTWTRTTIPPLVSNDRWATFGEDVNGEIYVLSNPTGNGQLYKIKDPSLSQNIIESASFVITPNPSINGKFKLSFSKTTKLKEVNAYTLQGQLVFSSTYNSSTNEVSIDLFNVSSGAYIIEVLTKDGKASQNKLIIE